MIVTAVGVLSASNTSLMASVVLHAGPGSCMPCPYCNADAALNQMLTPVLSQHTSNETLQHRVCLHSLQGRARQGSVDRERSSSWQLIDVITSDQERYRND